MTLRRRVSFGLFVGALKIPVIGRIVLRGYVAAMTSKTVGGLGVWAAYREVVSYQDPARARRAIILMYEPRFNYMLGEMAAQNLGAPILGRSLFDYLFETHLRGYIERSQRNFGEYALDTYEKFPVERASYLRACTQVARLLKKCVAISTIVLPKYNDDYTLELIQAFHDAGWKTIVYDREGTVTKRRLALIPKIVARQAPACDWVVTYNDTHRAFFEEVFRLSATPPANLAVLGNPSSDEWFRSETLLALQTTRREPPRKHIVFFAFGEFSYVYDAEYLRGRDEVWRGLLTDIHQTLMEHLRAYPEEVLFYKRGAKGNRDYWPGSEALLGLENARLVPNTASANELIAGSDVILAFQTTALIDAMHTDKVIIYCAWGDRYAELRDGLIDFDGYARTGAILHASSPAELARYLTIRPEEITVNIQARTEIRETFTSNPDGRVSARFVEWLSERLDG